MSETTPETKPDRRTYTFARYSVEVGSDGAGTYMTYVVGNQSLRLGLYHFRSIEFKEDGFGMDLLSVKLAQTNPWDYGRSYLQPPSEWFFDELFLVEYGKTVEEKFRGGPDSKTYKILLSEPQLRVYEEALEMYSRLLSGQAGLIEKIMVESGAEKQDAEVVRNAIENAIRKHNNSDTYGNYVKRRISYDMYREVLHFWAKGKNGGADNVYAKRNLISYQPCPEVTE